MLLLTYINEKTHYKVDFNRISDNVVEIKGDLPVKDTGFCLSRPNENDNWDYSNYTTIYRKIDGGAQFSDDGRVYESVSEPEELTEQEQQQTSMEQLMAEIETLKNELSATDYQIIKCSECALVGEEIPYDIGALHTERQATRDAINQKENELEVLKS